jgi:SHS family lactate transporter-like MFS transporter
MRENLRSINRSQWNTLAAGALAWAFDSWDGYLLVYVLSDIAKEFRISLGVVSLALMFSYLTRWAGGMLFGDIAGRWGRKKSLMGGIFIFGFFTMVTGLAPSFKVLLAIRLCFGLGMGGVFGSAGTLVIESVPSSVRGFASGFYMLGFYLGSVIAPWTYYALFPHFGWRGLFYFGGISLLLIPYIHFTVAESPVWTARMKDSSQGKAVPKVLPPWKLFTPGFIGITLALLLVDFGEFFDAYPFHALLPTYLKTVRHAPIHVVAFAGSMIGVGAIFGSVFGGWFSDKIGRKRTLALGYLVGMIPVAVALLSPTPAIIVIAATTDGFVFGVLSGILTAFENEHYPTELRAAGNGFIHNLGSLAGSIAAVIAATLNRSVGWVPTILLIVFAGAVMGMAGLRFTKETSKISLTESTTSETMAATGHKS